MCGCVPYVYVMRCASDRGSFEVLEWGNRLASDVGTPPGMRLLVRSSMVTISVGGEIVKLILLAAITSIQCKTVILLS